MPDLGKLRWVMDVDTTRFDAKLRGARATIAGVGAGLAALGVGRRVAGVYGRAETLVQAGKTTGIGVEALQELEAAAGQSGMAPGEMLSSLTAFSRAVAQLQGGRGPLKRVPGRARGVLGQVMSAQRAGGTEAALAALSAGVAGMEPGLGGVLAEKAGFATPQAYELLAGGPQALAEARGQYRGMAAPMTQSQAEEMKRRGDIVEARARQAGAFEARLVANLTGVDVGRAQGGAGTSGALGQVIRYLSQIADNTREGGKIGP